MRGRPKSQNRHLKNDDFINKTELKKKVEVRTMLLDRPMTYAEFKKLDENFKVLYIKNLRETYHIGNVQLAEMMGTDNRTLGNYLANHGIKVGKTGRNPMTKAEQRAWKKFYQEGQILTKETSEVLEMPKTEIVVAKPMPEPEEIIMKDSASATISVGATNNLPYIDSISSKVGAANIVTFIKTIAVLMEPNKTYTLSITIE